MIWRGPILSGVIKQFYEQTLWSDALEGSVLLAAGLWLAPRVMRHHLTDLPDPELAARARHLTQRVQTLTQTRHDAVDSAAAVAGYPNINVTAGYLWGLPVGISFFGRAWSEPTLLKIAYSFEQLTKARQKPRFLPTIAMRTS